MSDDRAERLRSRRKRSAEKVQSTTEDKTVKPDKPDKTDKPDTDDDDPVPAKDRDDWSALQMRLPDDVREDLELALDETNLELKKEGEDKLEKLLHWYPLVVTEGIDAIAEMDVDELNEKAKRFE